jgi:thioesterase domain-containing protein
VPIRTGGYKPPLFLVHGAEGNVLLYRELAERLDREGPVYGFQSLGLDGRSNPERCVESMAARYIREMQSLQPQGPYYLGGYCLGGVIAYEMAQQLVAKGHEVGLLAMFETYNIASLEKRLPAYYAIWHVLQNIGYHAGNIASIQPEDRWKFFRRKLSTVTSRLKMAARAAISRPFGRPGSRRKPLYGHIPITKINHAALRNYRPRPYPGQAMLFRPRRHFAGLNHQQFGWAGLVEKGMVVHRLAVFPRGMLLEPFVQEVAETLRKLIDSTDPNETGAEY